MFYQYHFILFMCGVSRQQMLSLYLMVLLWLGSALQVYIPYDHVELICWQASLCARLLTYGEKCGLHTDTTVLQKTICECVLTNQHRPVLRV